MSGYGTRKRIHQVEDSRHVIEPAFVPRQYTVRNHWKGKRKVKDYVVYTKAEDFVHSERSRSEAGINLG